MFLEEYPPSWRKNVMCHVIPGPFSWEQLKEASLKTRDILQKKTHVLFSMPSPSLEFFYSGRTWITRLYVNYGGLEQCCQWPYVLPFFSWYPLSHVASCSPEGCFTPRTQKVHQWKSRYCMRVFMPLNICYVLCRFGTFSCKILTTHDESVYKTHECAHVL